MRLVLSWRVLLERERDEIHKTDLSWTVKVNNLRAWQECLHAADEKKVSLGVKQLWDDP